MGPCYKTMENPMPLAAPGSAEAMGVRGVCEVELTRRGQELARRMGADEACCQYVLCIPDVFTECIECVPRRGGGFRASRYEGDLIASVHILRLGLPGPPIHGV